tara:strand:- start:174 stop:305 length:132 start_codon:yes stop_codon:yes gene_type:complete
MVIHNHIFDDDSNVTRKLYQAKELLEKNGYKVTKLIEEQPKTI